MALSVNSRGDSTPPEATDGIGGFLVLLTGRIAKNRERPGLGRENNMSYVEFFMKATELYPYAFQTVVAEEPDLPALVKVPTGAGKTEAAVLGWLYRLCQHPDAAVRDSTSRRLVYCLPTRTLVEQIAGRAERWLARLGMACDVGVFALMGGEPRTEWYLTPEKPSIVVGTQDMLLSRALNRGYGTEYDMWPIEYGLLNNDSFWVMDEVQLMENGLPTSTQLAGLREKLKTFGPNQSMWMSATARPDWLHTFDHRAPLAAQVVELNGADLADARLRRLHSARKVVTEAPFDLRKPKEVAELIAEKHKSGTLTLAIANTVEKAQGLYTELNRPRTKVSPDAEIVLVHSRFREDDRREKLQRLSASLDGGGRIVVATQAVEAGVDVSARTLVTEIAPWASMVQRFGRCNRQGEYERGDVLWLDVGNRSYDTAPYETEEVDRSRRLMRSLAGRPVGPADLAKLGDAIGDPDHQTVIRERDVVGLFDTTPDLSGSYVDVSHYIRGANERDVSVFWRDLAEGNTDEPVPRHNEIVSVPLGPGGIGDDMRHRDRKVRIWDFLDHKWRRVQLRDISPGTTLMLDASQGGYSQETGWTPSSKKWVEPIEPVPDRSSKLEAGYGSEPSNTSQRRWVALSDHSRHVECEARSILAAMSQQLADPSVGHAVVLAALYHDVGKAHSTFQEMLRQNLPEGEGRPLDEILAKSPGKGRFEGERRHFRHELGSALAVLEHVLVDDERVRDLAAYLAAAHHGKVRLVMRSLPGAGRSNGADSNPDPDRLLGYRLSDPPETLPSVDLGEGLQITETKLDLSIAKIGLGYKERRSWLERSLGLLEWLGPFRLAYLEAIVRAADMRASKREQEGLE